MSGTTTIFGTSTSSTFSSDLLTDSEKVDVRRFCGYQLFGNNPYMMGYRFFEHYGFLEYRLINASPSEFQIIRKYLSIIYNLEDAVFTASTNLDTNKAAGGWERNTNEAKDREKLFMNAKIKLCEFIGVPYGSYDNPGSNNNICEIKI